MKDKHGLLNAPIGRVLFNMSLPNLIGILTIYGGSLIDTYFISLLGTESLAAVSFTFPVAIIFSSIAIGIGAAVSTNLARLIGAGNQPQAKAFLFDALLLTFLLVSALVCIGIMAIDPLFTLLGANELSLPLIHDYMLVWFLGAPLLVLLMVGNQGIRATGDTYSPAIIMSVAAIINLILDPLLIFGLGPFPELGIQGAAIATSISWLFSASVAVYILVFKKQILVFTKLSKHRIIKNWCKLGHIARPAALMNMINPIANGIILAMLARVDQAAVAAYGAGVRLETLFILGIMALNSSLMPFVGQNLGAGQHQRAKDAMMLSLRFALVLQTLLYLPIFLSADFIAQLFSNDAVVIDWLSFYIKALPAAYGPLAVVIIFATCLNAYHRPIQSLVINLVRLFILMLPLAAIGLYFGGVKGLLIALPITNTIMGIACYVMASRITEPESVTASTATESINTIN
ncbi:MATE family efflux transporter [Pseudomonadota bacterium]|uniref:MATE family efflux transporter n=1 Tax=unclassified Shewanella TaxID=196818 RepID=UPI0026E3A86D|nr:MULTISPECIES: MATE family efflux transporter [unclassified Shewanella]MDO6618768.1 MATE family efflux transporter [Shewanella sp. 6_MG-2023]MDO6639785.1 MATE family efflux transporter [Shewanella sp. 5_MG-2023]MDO6775516.1 MATE family efflux transporter [Shewanella sp. 3_MG-2023]